MKYLVIDFYEGEEILYCGESADKARRADKTRNRDTDGECDVRIYDSFHNPNAFIKRGIPLEG